MSLGTMTEFAQFGAVGAGNSFPNPWFDIASLAMPNNLRSALYWCLLPGTLIERDGVALTAIEEMAAGMTVLTRGGTHERVIGVSKRHHDGELVRLVVSGFDKTLPFKATPDHRMWRIKTPKLKPSRVNPRLEHAELVPISDVRVGDYIATPLPRFGTHEIPRFSGWLLGMYVAKGCFIHDGESRSATRFTCGVGDEKLGIIARLQDEIVAAVDFRPEPYTPNSRPDLRLVTVSDPEMPDWLYEHGGSLAATKKMSPRLLNYGPKFILSFLGGWLDGDGGAQAGNCSAVWTVSRKLVYQIIRLSNMVGLTPSVCAVPPEGGAVRGGQTCYQLQYGAHDTAALAPYSVKLAGAAEPQTKRRRACFIADGYVFRRVMKTGREGYSGPVYNLHVENDHSYIADGVTTSNCEFIHQGNGTLNMAMKRLNAYFMTDIEILNASDDETEKWKEHYEHRDVLGVVEAMNENKDVYGNSFASLVVPFIRFLVCPKCGYMAPLGEVKRNPAFNFEWQLPNFVATCPTCRVASGYRGPWIVKDETDDEEKKINIKIWNPHEIELLYCHFSHDVHYLWRIPEDYKRQVRQGHLFHLERVPMQVLEAIHRNQVFRFNEDAIFHMKEPTIAGIYNRGWGIPRILRNFRQAFFLQVLRRQIEAIALDYVIPFRVISPAPREGAYGGGTGMAADPFAMYSGSDFRMQAMSMIRRRHRDPAGMQIFPFPLQYQLLGAEANQMAPKDLLDYANQTFLNEIGVPVELYNGSLQIQAAPPALRLMESTFHGKVHDSNAFLRWYNRQIAQVMSWEEVKSQLKRVTIADDLEKLMMEAQLMMSQQMSGTTVFRDMGRNWRQEQKQIAEESQFQAELQARAQEQMQQAGYAQDVAKGQQAGQQGGQPQGQGGGQGGGQGDPSQMMQAPGPVSQYLSSMNPTVPVSPQDQLAAADSIATDLLGQPEAVKNSELRKLKIANEPLYAAVKERMAQKRRGVRSDAGNQAVGQMQQQLAQAG